MKSALDSLHEYYNAFSTLDLKAIAAWYCEPSMTIAPQGMFSAANRAALVDSLAPLVAGLRARGYGRSEFIDAHVTPLGEADALVRGVAVRYTAAGPELERVKLAYLMHRGDGGWKIAVLLAES